MLLPASGRIPGSRHHVWAICQSLSYHSYFVVFQFTSALHICSAFKSAMHSARLNFIAEFLCGPDLFPSIFPLGHIWLSTHACPNSLYKALLLTRSFAGVSILTTAQAIMSASAIMDLWTSDMSAVSCYSIRLMVIILFRDLLSCSHIPSPRLRRSNLAFLNVCAFCAPILLVITSPTSMARRMSGMDLRLRLRHLVNFRLLLRIVMIIRIFVRYLIR